MHFVCLRFHLSLSLKSWMAIQWQNTHQIAIQPFRKRHLIGQMVIQQLFLSKFPFSHLTNFIQIWFCCWFAIWSFRPIQNRLWFNNYSINIFCFKFSVSADNRDFSPSTIAVGPSADNNSFNQLDFPHVCANITQPFGFPETRNISCIRWVNYIYI